MSIRKKLSRVIIFHLKKYFHTTTLRAKIKPDSVKRVLLMGHDKLGDTLVLTPVMNVLKSLNPQIEIDCLGYDASYDILVGDERISNLYRYKQNLSIYGLCKSLRAREYDLILSLTWRKGLREGLIALWASTKNTKRITIFRKAKYAPFWHKMVRVPNVVYHTADKYLYLISQLFDMMPIEKGTMSLELRANSLSKVKAFLQEFGVGEFILINLSAGTKEMTRDILRAWSREQYVSLISKLLDTLDESILSKGLQKISILLVYLEIDEKHASWIHEQLSIDRVFKFPPTHNVHDLIALVSEATLLISPDTSFIHMASATGTPTVGLFSNKGKIETWSSYHVQSRAIAALPDGYMMTPLSKISVESVFNATISLLNDICVQNKSSA